MAETPNLSAAFGGSAKAGNTIDEDPFAFLDSASSISAPSPQGLTEEPLPVVPEKQASMPAPDTASVDTAIPATRTESSPPRRTSGTKPRSPRRSQPDAPSADMEELTQTTSQVQVYLKQWAIRTARKVAEADDLTNAQVAYNAIDAVKPELALLVERRRVDHRPTGSSFPGHSTRRRPRRGQGEGPRTLWSIQATPQEREVLERFSHDFGAESLSQLVSVAMEAYLADHPLR